MIERVPRNSLDLYKMYGFRNPVGIAEIIVRRLTGQMIERTAIIKSGSKMQVMLPEGISSIIKFAGDYEPSVSDSLAAALNKGMVFWNIGSHIGLRVVQGTDVVGKDGLIYAFEPTPRTKVLLDKNSIGRGTRVVTSRMAVGDTSGVVGFNDYGWQFSGCNSAAPESRLVRRMGRKQPIPAKIECPIATVDDLIKSNEYRPPEVMVVDAEGYEKQIFSGASVTLRTYKPIVIFEAGDLGSSQTLQTINLLQGYGYVIFERGDKKFIPHVIRTSYPDSENLIAIHPQATKRVVV